MSHLRSDQAHNLNSISIKDADEYKVVYYKKCLKPQQLQEGLCLLLKCLEVLHLLFLSNWLVPMIQRCMSNN